MASTAPRIDSHERNLVINGNYNYWQRNTTSGAVAQGFSAYAPDRFKKRGYGAAGAGTSTLSRSTDVPTLAQSGYNSQYSMLLTVNVAATNNHFETLQYVVEGFDYQSIHTKKIRLQFWVKTSIAGTYYVVLNNASINRSFRTPYTVAAASTWQKISLDIQLDTTGTWAFDNTAGLIVEWMLGNPAAIFQTGTANVWDTAGLVVPAGSTALVTTGGATFQLAQVALYQIDAASTVDLPFIRAGRNMQDELAMCQRYYEKSYNLDVNPGTASSTGAVRFRSASTNHIQTMSFAVAKRANPTITYYSNGVGGASGFWLDSSSGIDRAVTNQINGQSAHAAAITGSIDTNISEGHWTADSEL